MAAGRWIKRILIALIVVIALLFAGVVTALMLIDTQALKGVISERVESATGRKLTIEGPLDISVFPWLGFELGSTRLANATGFGDRPFAGIERAELRVRILPLFQRRVAIDTVVLHGLQVNLARNAGGVTNWADLAGGGETATAEPAKEEPAAAEGGDGLAGVSFRVEGVELSDAAFSWRDATTGQAFSVHDLNLKTGPLAPNEPTPVNLSVALEQEDGPAVDLSADTRLTFDPAAQTAALDDLELNVEATGDAIPGGSASVQVNAGIKVDAKAGRAEIDPLRLSLLDRVNGGGKVSARFGGDVPSFTGDLALDEFSPRKLMDDLDIALPEMADKKVLHKASLRLGFSGTPAKVQVKDLQARFDDTKIDGNLTADLAGAVPAAGFTLNVDGIDVDRYLAKGGEEAPAAAAGGAGGDPIASIPLEPLRGFDLDGNVDIGRVGFHGLDMTDMRLAVKARRGLLTLERADLKVAGGQLKTNGQFDARSDKPALKLTTNIGAIQAEPFLKAFLGNAPVTGKLDSSLDLAAAGGTLDEWIGGLDGRIAATFAEGAVQGINIAQQLRVASAKLTGDKVKEAKETRRTDFSVLSFVGEIRDGVLHSDKLDLRAPLLRISGKGDVNLGKRDLDYTARVLVTGTLKGEGGESAEKLRGLEVPIHFTGPLLKPKIDVALMDALKGRETAKVKAKQEAAEQELEQKKEAAKAEAEQAAEEEKAKLEEKKKKAAEEAKKKLEDKLKKAFQ